MSDRPEIVQIDTGAELRRWYWLRAELAAELSRRALPTSGSKSALLSRLAVFLDTGEVLRLPPRKPASKFDWHTENLTADTLITDSYRNTQNVRRFFKSHIGQGFKFNIVFMAWMKQHTGQPLSAAVAAYREQIAQAAEPDFRTAEQPDNQFNSYTRAFMDDNPELGMREVRHFWALKRALPSEDGKHQYAPSDLELCQAILDASTKG